MKIYFLDLNNYYVGRSIEIDDGDPIPEKVADVDLPSEIPEGQYPKWDGEKWTLTEVSPEDFNLSLPWPEPVYQDLMNVPPVLSTWDDVRNRRDLLLAQSDWTQTRDIELPNNDEWVTYRQALRDIPSRYDSVETIEWPTLPVNV